MEPGAAVLVVEDEPEIRRLLRDSLDESGYRVIEAANGARGAQEAATHKPDLVLLDLGLPDMDGLEVINRVRVWSGMPIIVLSARDGEAAKVAALEAGADDYVTKPFGMAELIARVRVALRHAARPAGGGKDARFRLGTVQVDLERRVVRDKAGHQIHLTPIEFRLLAALAKHAGMVLTHRNLLRDVWGPSHVDQAHYLRIYMKQLRHKLEPDPARPKYLITDIGVGYRLLCEFD
jgi:two-component system KDP operon response regulator KdpE